MIICFWIEKDFLSIEVISKKVHVPMKKMTTRSELKEVKAAPMEHWIGMTYKSITLKLNIPNTRSK